jgi:nucleotide-binding universal stress UspA family protein
MAADSDTPSTIGRIVAGVDGSSTSLDALSWAARLAHLTGSMLEVVTTWEWPPSFGWAAPAPTDFDPEADIRTMLDSAADKVRSAYPGLRVETRLINGHPSPVLVEESKGADLLVVGNRGHGEFVGMLLGSCSGHCATNAHCPVLIYRTPTD